MSKFFGTTGGKAFRLFGKDSDTKRNAYAIKLVKEAIAAQLLGGLTPGEPAIEEYVKCGLEEYDHIQAWLQSK